jgi:hypothetical protein
MAEAFIKVNTDDRTPDKDGVYLTDRGEIRYFNERNIFHHQILPETIWPEYWMEPIDHNKCKGCDEIIHTSPYCDRCNKLWES